MLRMRRTLRHLGHEVGPGNPVEDGRVPSFLQLRLVLAMWHRPHQQCCRPLRQVKIEHPLRVQQQTTATRRLAFIRAGCKTSLRFPKCKRMCLQLQLVLLGYRQALAVVAIGLFLLKLTCLHHRQQAGSHQPAQLLQAEACVVAQRSVSSMVYCRIHRRLAVQ